MNDKLSDGKIRFSGKAVINGTGSEMRSSNCPFEAGCVYFKINDVIYKWFNEAAAWKYSFSNWHNKEIDIHAIVTTQKTLQRVKIIE